MTQKTFETKKDYIVKAVKEKILSGDLKPGVRLKTKELALEFGTSEIPVREAINQLVSLRLVEVIPHVGATTARISSTDLQEIFQIRGELESLATRLATPALTLQDLDDIERIHLELKQALEDDAPSSRLNALNREFHMRLYRHSGNLRLITMIEELWNHAGRYPAPLSGRDPDTIKSLADHEEILRLLKRHDVTGVTAITLTHKQRSFERILKAVRQSES